MNNTERAIALALTAIMPLTLAACFGGMSREVQATSRHDVQKLANSPNGDAQMTITLLGFEGCPLTPLMRHRLEQAIARLEELVELLQLDQHSLDALDLRRGYPAPTVMVNGSDLFGMVPPTSPSMGCRMYDGPDGVPSVDDLVGRLSNVLPDVAEDEGSEG